MSEQQGIDGIDTVISPISGKKERILMSNGARIRLMQIFDKEIKIAHEKSHDPDLRSEQQQFYEDLRLALCRIKGVVLCC